MPHGWFTGLDETYPVNYAVLSKVEQQHVRPAGAQQLHRGLACRLDSEQYRVHWVVVKAAREAFGSVVCAYVPDSGGAVLGSADDQAPASAAFIAGIHT